MQLSRCLRIANVGWPTHSFLIRIALLAALVLTLFGASSTSQAQTITMRSADAHAYANAMTLPSHTEQKLISVVNVLRRYCPLPVVNAIAWVITRSPIQHAVAWRIRWVADRSNAVHVYHAWWLPYWADRAW